METIRVNMTPCEDVQTIHASQNDNEAREWGFELHNNGEKIDSSSISDQMVFKAYEGGTEEILPTNGSVPSTAPIIADIQYPQGELTDQSFTYRQSPTEEDGLAKITNIKGNTLNWNQLARVELTSTSGSGITFTNNGDGSFTLNGTATAQTDFRFSTTNGTDNLLNFPTGKYLFVCENVSSSVQIIVMSYPNYVRMMTLTTPSILTTEITGLDNCFILVRIVSGTVLNNVKLKPQLFCLTKIFGVGNEPTSVSDFTSLFPLPYYAYNQGTLLSFNGNGIKTVGKNLLNARSTYTNNGITFTNDNGVITINGTATANAFFTTNIGLRNGSYFIGAFNDDISNSVHIAVQNKSGAYPLDGIMSVKNRVFSLNNDIKNFIIWVNSGTTLNNFVVRPMVSLVSAETFEPYTSSTLSLPISTYFPNGMKSAGSVYDELTPSKAITRIGAVDLGTLAFSQSSNFYYRQNSQDLGIKADAAVSFIAVDSNITSVYYYGNSGQFRVYVNDISIVPSGMLYYELATPTETSFTTASLVTENAEIPLSNEDGVLIGKCTEQLSSESGFFDAKIKLADEDGECYSNKIQLHIERSPQ